VTTDPIARRRPFRGSPTARAIGSAIFVFFILAYSIVITLALLQEPPQRRVLALLIFVWGIAATALILIFRSWRKSRPARVTTVPNSE